MANPKRYLKEIKEAIAQATSIISQPEDTMTLQDIKTAAIQAQLAASTLYSLVGVMEAEFHDRK